MEELRKILPDWVRAEPVKMAVEKEIPKAKIKVDLPTPMPGHTYFQLDKSKLEITQIEYEDVVVDITRPNHLVRKIIIKENHLYTSALNKKNAEKHFKKMILREKGYPV